MTTKSSKLTEGEQQEKGDILSRWSMIYQSLSARVLEDRNKRAGLGNCYPSSLCDSYGKKKSLQTVFLGTFLDLTFLLSTGCFKNVTFPNVKEQ